MFQPIFYPTLTSFLPFLFILYLGYYIYILYLFTAAMNLISMYLWSVGEHRGGTSLSSSQCWRDFTQAQTPVSKTYVYKFLRKEKPNRCHWIIYCTYNMFKMFRAILCPSSGARYYIVLLPPMVCDAFVAGCWRSGAEQQAVCPGRGTLQHPSSWTHSLLPCTWPPTTNNQALHAIGGNNTHIVSSSWWWA